MLIESLNKYGKRCAVSSDVVSPSMLDNSKDNNFKLSIDKCSNDELYQVKNKTLDTLTFHKLKHVTTKEGALDNDNLSLKCVKKDDDDDDNGRKNKRKTNIFLSAFFNSRALVVLFTV